MPKTAVIVFLIAELFSVANLCQASDPYIPITEQQVLERLPESALLARTEWLSRNGAGISANLEVKDSLKAALKFIQQGRKNSDPRPFGYAESLLSPIIKQNPPPTAALILLASIKDHNHEFQDAIAILRTVLEKEPGNLQARLSLASALTVTGELSDARSSCEKLLSARRPLIAATCAAAPASLQGQAQQVFQALKAVIGDATSVSSYGNAEQIWAVSLLGEIAERLGFMIVVFNAGQKN